MRLRDREFAVIGLGRFGSGVALQLEENGYHVLGIDMDEEIVQRMAPLITHVASLDSTDEEALNAIDILSFDTVVVAIGEDFEANLLTTVALKNLGVRQVISKAPTNRQVNILSRIGADRVIQPEYEAGKRLAQELSTPAILEKVALGPDHSLVEVVVPDKFSNQTILQSHIRQKYGVSILLVKRGDEVFVSPRADFILLPDDLLVIIGKEHRVDAFCTIE